MLMVAPIFTGVVQVTDTSLTVLDHRQANSSLVQA